MPDDSSLLQGIDYSSMVLHIYLYLYLYTCIPGPPKWLKLIVYFDQLPILFATFLISRKIPSTSSKNSNLFPMPNFQPPTLAQAAFYHFMLQHFGWPVGQLTYPNSIKFHWSTECWIIDRVVVASKHMDIHRLIYLRDQWPKFDGVSRSHPMALRRSHSWRFLAPRSASTSQSIWQFSRKTLTTVNIEPHDLDESGALGSIVTYATFRLVEPRLQRAI